MTGSARAWPGGTGSSVGEALQHMNLLGPRAKVIIVVSDFRGRMDWSAPMTELAGRNTVVAVEIRDPREQELPDVGELHLVDPESGRQLRVDTSKRHLRERFAAAAAAERVESASTKSRTRARAMSCSQHGAIGFRTLATFLAQKEGRR